MTPADKAKELQILYDKIRVDRHYRSEAMGRVLVPGEGFLAGNPITFIGEAPGRAEESEKRPFVGAAGRNLCLLLDRIGLSRQQVFITNLVKYRPVTRDDQNRAPNRKESSLALPYLLSELAIIAPSVTVCLGLSAARAVLGKPGLTMREANGVVFEAHGLKILVSYHPSPLNYGIPAKKAALGHAFKVLEAMVPGLPAPGCISDEREPVRRRGLLR